MRFPAHGEAAGVLQHLDHSVPAGDVGADLLPLLKGKEGDAHGVVLGQGLAGDLTGLVGDLVRQDQLFVFFDVFHGALLDSFSFISMSGQR